MSYFNSNDGTSTDPWGSYGNAPSYSFGDQFTPSYPTQENSAPSFESQSSAPTIPPMNSTQQSTVSQFSPSYAQAAPIEQSTGKYSPYAYLISYLFIKKRFNR